MLPDWINYIPTLNLYHTNLKPCQCERCEFMWFPRMNSIGDLSLNTCPKCKSKLWNKQKK